MIISFQEHISSKSTKYIIVIILLICFSSTVTGCNHTEINSYDKSDTGHSEDYVIQTDETDSLESDSELAANSMTTPYFTGSAESSENPGDPIEEISDETESDIVDDADLNIKDTYELYPLTGTQRNSIALLNYLTFLSQKIESSKTNRLYLEEVYSSLYNNIKATVIDETTQNHINSLMNIIKDYRQLQLKRERLAYIYEQDKAKSITETLHRNKKALDETHLGTEISQGSVLRSNRIPRYFLGILY